MPPYDVLGDPGAPVMLGTQDDDVGVQFLRSLEDDVRDVVFGGVDEFPVDGDSRSGEVVDGILHRFPFPGGYVIFAIEDAETRPGVDVVRDDVAARDVQQMDRSPAIVANWVNRSKESSGESGDTSMATSIRSYISYSALSGGYWLDVMQSHFHSIAGAMWSGSLRMCRSRPVLLVRWVWSGCRSPGGLAGPTTSR